MHWTRARRSIVIGAAAATLLLGTSAANAATPTSGGGAGAEQSTSFPDRIVLNPTERPEASQTVSWRSGDGGRVGSVEIGEVGSDSTRTVRAQEQTPGRNGGGVVHNTATVDGLDASTAYRYRVGGDDRWSPWYEFTTAASSDEPWTFLYFGDAQNSLDDAWPDVAGRAFDAVPEASLSLHAGDLINNADSDDEWSLWFAGHGDTARTRNVIATPGNHEYKGDPDLTQYRSHFGFPRNGPFTRNEDVWFTDYQGVRFVSLNANVLIGIDQMIWMHQILANNPNRWTVVTFHQPLFSGSVGRDNPGIRLAWQPIFEQYGVDLVLQGHDHVYARGHMADREAIDGTHSGTVYAVAVAGGKHYELALADNNMWTTSGARREVAAQQISTYQAISVERDRLTYRAVVARLGESPQPAGLAVGDTLDGFTITKDDRGKKVVTNQVPQVVADADVPGVPFDPIGDLLGDIVK